MSQPADNSRETLFPKNAPGDFYAAYDVCLACLGPQETAPDLIDFQEEDKPKCLESHCYVKQQPRTPEELARMIEAVACSCVEAFRYGGNDPAILEKLRKRGLAHLCDALCYEDKPD